MEVKIEKILEEISFESSKRKNFPLSVITDNGVTLTYVAGSRLSEEIRNQFGGFQYPKSYVYLDQEKAPYESLFLLTPENSFKLNKLTKS